MKRLAVLFVVLVLSGCGSPKEVAPAPKPADEAAAIHSLGEINDAQSNFHRRTRRYAQTLEELVQTHLLTAEPTADDTGYTIKLRPAADAESYTVTAIPVAASPTTRHFFTDNSGDIRSEQGKDALASSPKI